VETTEHMARPRRADEPSSPIERTEEVLTWAGIAAVATVRVVELAAIAVAALLVVAPLAILVVVVPAIAFTALIALVTGVVAAPVFVVRYAHRQRAAHAHKVVRRLADAGPSEQASTTSRVRRVAARAQRNLYAKPAP
jgi:hypothetical protein